MAEAENHTEHGQGAQTTERGAQDTSSVTVDLAKLAGVDLTDVNPRAVITGLAELKTDREDTGKNNLVIAPIGREPVASVRPPDEAFGSQSTGGEGHSDQGEPLEEVIPTTGETTTLDDPTATEDTQQGGLNEPIAEAPTRREGTVPPAMNFDIPNPPLSKEQERELFEHMLTLAEDVWKQKTDGVNFFNSFKPGDAVPQDKVGKLFDAYYTDVDKTTITIDFEDVTDGSERGSATQTETKEQNFAWRLQIKRYKEPLAHEDAKTTEVSIISSNKGADYFLPGTKGIRFTPDGVRVIRDGALPSLRRDQQAEVQNAALAKGLLGSALVDPDRMQLSKAEIESHDWGNWYFGGHPKITTDVEPKKKFFITD